mgnify:CR=1 FL=1
MVKNQKKISAGVLLGVLFFSLTLLLGIAVFADTREGILEIDVLDIGQGDAILIQTPTRARVLIDGGRDTTVSKKIAEELPFWERTIDVMILTHPDLDHVGGLPDVLRRYRVGAILLTEVEKDLPAYQEFLARAREEDIPLQYVYAGDSLRLGPDLVLAIFAPEKGTIDSEDLNNFSIVAKLMHNKRSFLFTGDAEDKGERRMIAGGADLSADVLKLGHHGSRYSSSAVFFKSVGARAGLISAGAHNSYGHPHPDVLKRMADASMTAYRTDTQGTIEIISDGEFLTITTEK